MPNNSRRDAFHGAFGHSKNAKNKQWKAAVDAASAPVPSSGSKSHRDCAGVVKPSTDAKQLMLKNLHSSLTWSDTNGVLHLLPRGKLQHMMHTVCPNCSDKLSVNDLAQALHKALSIKCPKGSGQDTRE